MKEINCKGLSYLQIIREIKKYFNSIGEGEALVVIENDLERSNVIRYAAHKGYHIDEDNYDEFRLKIEKRGCLEEEDEEDIFSILITTDKIGEGSSELGIILMNEYLEALNEYDRLPREILFLNEGVKLFSKDSKSIEYIKMFNEKGVKLLISDTSLKYYNLQKPINFGEVTNMYDMVVAMKKSKRLIKL